MKKSFFLAPLFFLIFVGCYPSISLRSIYDKEYNIPRLKNTSVKDKDTEITLRPSISLEFTESMDFYEVERYITLFKSEVDKVESKIDIVNDKNIIITPIDYLMPDGTYTVKIERSLKSITGFTLPKEIKINFLTTVNDTIPPKVIGTSFSDNSNDIAGNSNFIVYFSKAIDSGSLLSGIKLVDSKKLDVSIDISLSLNSVIIKPESVLKPWSDYTIKITKDIRDETQNKNNLAEEKEYKITTKGDYRYRTTVNGSKYSFSPYFFIKSVVNKTEYFYISRPDNNCVSQYRLNDIDYENNNSYIYIGDIGGYGSEEGKMINPYGMATDESGNLYVCDKGNSRIQKFNYKGEFILSFGNKPNDPYNLNIPYGIAYKKGYLYITDNNKVLKYNKYGVYITSWIINDFFHEKSAKEIMVDNNEQIYVADNVYKDGVFSVKIKKFDKNGVFLGSIINYDLVQFSILFAIDKDNNIFIYNNNTMTLESYNENGVRYSGISNFKVNFSRLFIDYDNFFYFCSKEGKWIAKYKKNNSGISLNYLMNFNLEQNINIPKDIAVDKENNLMLTYYSSDSKIVKFSPDGKQISDNTTDKFPYSISIDSDNNVFIGINYYLSDYNYLSKIIRYDQNGKKILEWGEYGTEDDKLNVIVKIRFGKDGNLYILDRKNKIGIFSKDGVFIKAFGDFNFPTGIAFDIAGNIYVSDNSDKIYIFNDKHEILNTIDMNDRFSVAYISDIIIKNDLLFVSDYYNQKLLIFNLNNNSIVFKKNIILNKGHYAGTLALNSNNDLYFIDEATNGFYIYDFVSD